MNDCPVVIVGHVDHGKSTLVSRLMLETGVVPQDRLEKVKKICEKSGKKFEPAFLLDAFQEEQAQGITIDATQIKMKINERTFTLIDTPGHREFLKNMLSGASRAQAAILLVDASQGICRETRSHTQLLNFLGVYEVIVAINKMDIIDYSQKNYCDIKDELKSLSKNLNINYNSFIPISSLHNVNITDGQNEMNWHTGLSLIQALSQLSEPEKTKENNLVIPIQDVYKFDNRRILVGRIENGSLKKGDSIVFSPSGKQSKIATIEDWPSNTPYHSDKGSCVGFTLEDQIFVERGQVATHLNERPICANEFTANVFWMGQEPLSMDKSYLCLLNTQKINASILKIESCLKIGQQNIKTKNLKHLEKYDIARITFKSDKALACEIFDRSIPLGRFVIIDNSIASGSGTIVGSIASIDQSLINESGTQGENIFWEVNSITHSERVLRQGHCGCVIWLTGLPSSGKSTIGNALARKIFDMGHNVYRLDGDNMRHGLCQGLSFSSEDRKENIRRVGEVARLMADAGQIVIASFISPFREDRDNVRKRIPDNMFFEIFVSCPLSVCEKRDPKGLYKKAREGKIKNMTGIDSIYEPPLSPDLVVTSDTLLVDSSVELIIQKLQDSRIFQVN